MDTGIESKSLRSMQAAAGTLLLSRSDVERLLTPDQSIAAVEDAFRRHALGEAPSPGILGMHGGDGSFHVKAAFHSEFADRGPAYFAAKINANFPQNGARHGLPTIQGVLVLLDASTGLPLALMDSMAITALRTAAATAVAARHLSRESSRTVLLCGCGAQAGAQLRALLRVRSPSRVLACDQDIAKAQTFAGTFTAALSPEASIEVLPAAALAAAVSESDIVITCTTSNRFFITREMVKPGTFVAGVGADNENKQEIDPRLLANCTLVTDLTAQCAALGDLHHAIASGAMTADGVHAELGEVVAGLKPGRTGEGEITVFDSTGTALQDVAAAIAVYQRALAEPGGARFLFNA